MARSIRPTQLGLAMEADPASAALFWPVLGGVVGFFGALWCGDRGAIVLADVVAGVLGALAGGLVTLGLTGGEPESGAFFTSVITSVVGTLVCLSLWRATLEAVRRARSRF
jgi:uncharacterized membrane protein YeaQ/YmgE (transglycosylase-associated protein family)